jgi:hypothetical protein
VADEFHAFYTLYAFTKPVTYGKMEGWKVQVPSPASIKSFNSNSLTGRILCCVCREYFPLLGIVYGAAETLANFQRSSLLVSRRP